MQRRYDRRAAKYCASGTYSCLQAWTGMTEEELKQYNNTLPPNEDDAYLSYPYLSLIESTPVSPSSPFSTCSLPVLCELPNCECEQSRDCAPNYFCVGNDFLNTPEQKKGTRCLPLCNEDNTCGGRSRSYCPQSDCLNP